jgi:Cdc6-like AAA superfamily ATPase
MSNSRQLSLAAVENAFQPAQEVRDAVRFAGRKQQIQDAYYALITAGSHIAVVGNRGIGKSSLARQIITLGSGDNALLQKLELAADAPLDFLTVYLACGHGVTTIPELLTRLLTSRDCLAEWIYDVPKAKEYVTKYAPRFGFNVLGLDVGIDAEKNTNVTTEAVINSHSVETVFCNVLSSIVEKGIAKSGILVVIDEFDQIADPSGFASFLKAISTNVPAVKFCLVGVAHDIHELMKEHPSADRLFAGSIVRLPSMSPEEITEIINNAELAIDHAITFDEAAKARLVSLSQGHPYMTHLIGKYALRDALQNNAAVVTAESIESTVRSMAERGADPVLEGRYKKAVGASVHREVVLKSLAETQDQEDGEVRTNNAYKIAIDKGVDNPSQYVGQLTGVEVGAEVEKVRERVYRFKDSLFAAYVRLRPMLNKAAT